MKITDSTNLIETVIASGASSEYVNAIPTSQTTTGNGTISLTLGSPPECAISVAAGGKRPLMSDVNGVYKLLSAAIQSLQSRGALPFSSDFASAIGGYPLNAIVADTGTAGLYWVSTADANETVPGATGAAWEEFGWNQFIKQGWGFSNLGDNEIYIGWRTDGSGLGLGVDETDEGTFALKADVMPSQSVFGQNSQSYYTPTPSSTETTTHIVDLTFTAPYDGLVFATAHFNVSNIQPSQCQGLIQIQGSSYQPTTGAEIWSDTTPFPMSGSGVMRVKKGDSITVRSSYNVPESTSTFASVGQTTTYQFTPAGY